MNLRAHATRLSILTATVIISGAPPAALAQSQSGATAKPEKVDIGTLEANTVADKVRLADAKISEAKAKISEAEAKISEAKAKSQLAENKADSEADANQDKQKRLDDLASGKMLQYGFSAGVALSLSFMSKGGKKAVKVDNGPKPRALTYIMYHPWYLVGGEQQRKYCASNWASGQAAAQRFADADAEARAETILDRLSKLYDADMVAAGLKKPPAKIGRLGAHSSLAADLKRLLPGDTGSNAAARLRIFEALTQSRKHPKDKSIRYRAVLEISHSVVDWTIGAPGWCVGHKFGLYVGRPFPSEATVRYENKDILVATNPQISAGIGFSPNAYLSVLFGWTLHRPEAKSDTDEGEALARARRLGRFYMHSFDISIGGTLDLVTLLQP